MTKTSHLEKLCVALAEDRPIVLLLGQDVWRNDTLEDAVLKKAFQRFKDHSTVTPPDRLAFPKILENFDLPDDFYIWLAERYERQLQPLWMETISKLPLNAVFTSSVDPTIAKSFRVNGREVELVLSNQDNPAAPRNRQLLHLTYLFGRAGESNPSERPPRTSVELRQRKYQHAAPLIARLEETTTPLGVLLIDGLTCGFDWLESDILSGILGAFAPNQVFWFGWNPDEDHKNKESQQFFETTRNSVDFIQDRLAVVLRKLELSHKIDLSKSRYFISDGSVKIGDSQLEIESATRLKVSATTSIVEDSWTAPLAALGSDIKYSEFRRFHGQHISARRLFEGVRRNFSIERTFEKKLYKQVRAVLQNAKHRHALVLVHGQSGTGKSIALARLAYNIRKLGKHPVLLASHAPRLPAVEELDDFCLRAEEAGAEASLLICDANESVSRYSQLLRGFVSRGRRVVIVGSTYRIVDVPRNHKTSNAFRFIEVPADLNDSESKSLTNLVAKWTGFTLNASNADYMLPAIYYILPEVRPSLASGLARETYVAERRFRSRGKNKQVKSTNSIGSLGKAFIDLGFEPTMAILEQKLEDFLGHASDAASKIIDHVMVPGKFNCKVPINLLMRTVRGSASYEDIYTLFTGIDLFRWIFDDNNDVFVKPRLTVEAELICAKRLGTKFAEVEIVNRLIEKTNPSPYGNSECRFIRSMIHQIGPDGRFNRKYAPHYLELAQALTKMRNSRGILDPSLMLQEATLRRRVFRNAYSLPKGVDPAAVLEEARKIVDSALDEFDSSPSPGLRSVCSSLKVERAAIYGFRAVQRLKDGANNEEVWQYYKAARDSAQTAAFSADSYHATDISIWVPNDLLRDGNWNPQIQAEFLADIFDALERVDPTQFDPENHERFEQRRLKVGKTLNDNELQQDALEKLDQMGSCAGIFLQARSIGGEFQRSNKPTAEDISNADQMVSFMRMFQDRINGDGRCLRYLLKGLWLVATKSFLFGGERSRLPEQVNQIQEILTVLETLSNLEGTTGDPRMQYLRAVLMWRLNRENEAKEVWRLLSQETDFSDPRRVIRHHIWTESGGKPKRFHGRVISQYFGKGRVKVRIEDLHQNVELLQRDFPNQSWQRNATVSGGFYIAFNFIGPVADSPRRLRDMR